MDSVSKPVCKREVNLETSKISLSNCTLDIENDDDSKHHIKPVFRFQVGMDWNASTVVSIPHGNLNHINTARKRNASTTATSEKHKRKKTATKATERMKKVGRYINMEDGTENSKLQDILSPSEIDTSDISSDESFQKATDVIKYYLDKYTLQSSEQPTNSQNLNTSVEQSGATSISSCEDEETNLAISLSDIEMFDDSDSSSNRTQWKRGRKRAGRKKLKQVVEAYKIPKSKYDRALEMLNSAENRFDETPANYTARTSCIVRKRCERRQFEEATHDNEKLGLFRPDSLARIVCALDTCLENEDWKLIAKLMVFGCGLVDHRVAKEEIVTSFLTHGMLSLLLDQKVDATTLKLFLLKIGKTKCKETDVDEFLKCVNILLEREAIRKSPKY